MPHIPKLPEQKKLTREEARANVKKCIEESRKLHISMRNGTWKPEYSVNVVK